MVGLRRSWWYLFFSFIGVGVTLEVMLRLCCFPWMGDRHGCGDVMVCGL